MDQSDGHAPDASVNASPVIEGRAAEGGKPDPARARLHAVVMAARYYGMELAIEEFRSIEVSDVPSAASLSTWAQNAGMWARAVRLRWRHLMRLREAGPVVLLFNNGGAGLLVGSNSEHKVVLVRDPLAPEGEPAV
ncbi:MAG: hypothetical protein ABI224_17190, partial [Acetobacteraceae bacterium]